MKVLGRKKETQNYFSQLDFQKTYDSPQSEESRKDIFWKNLETIAHHNFKFRRGQSTFKMGINKFTDMTFREYSNMYKANETTQKIGEQISETISFIPASSYDKLRNESFECPSSFDWRQKGVVTAVKDQKYCGSCYAMSVLASVESQLFIKTGKLIQLSDQEIIDCASDFGTFQCEGGVAFAVFDYIKENGGISSAADYPYEAKAGECRRSEKEKVKIDMKGYGFMMKDGDDVLMSAVAELGPIMISIDTDHESFMHYASGVYYDEKCTTEVNHGAVVVGYGSEDGEDFWIVKNSFGEKWGESGYVRIIRGRGKDCSVADVPMFPILNDYEE